MKPKIYSALVVSAAILLAAAMVCLFFQNLATQSQQRAARDLEMSYRLEKIGQVSDKILKRQVIEDVYFRYLEDRPELVESVKSYNALTGELYQFFNYQATGTAVSLFDLKDEDGQYIQFYSADYQKFPPAAVEVIERIAALSLYENCKELFLSDPVLAHVLAGELGGSYGLWVFFWHTEYLKDNEEIRQQLSEYFDLTDRLTQDLEAYRSTLIFAES